MDYLYENLGDERFQEFCNMLISKDFPNTQAYPIGQPDGGRDAVSYSMTSTKKKFIVFQVKFVRNPNSLNDIYKWLKEIIESEAEKINRLILRGATHYYLFTNVKSSGHLDIGSKDKINRILEEKISVPAMCYWREDITMLFEKDAFFKWSFPELMNGQDVLNSALFSVFSEHKERRERVIRSYLADQYSQDDEVKFKQIDLQNRLLDLFTDVPVQLKKANQKNKQLRKILFNAGFSTQGDDYLFMDSRQQPSAAAFLLHSNTQEKIQRALLEGGPGQGKSTISQYVCQVHRVRLLNNLSDISVLPDNVKKSPIRFPLKMDLRHVASWVECKNPYKGFLSDEQFNKAWTKSLESFIVGHIIYHSKVSEFNVSDLASICSLSPMLFVFDGFDEIANHEVRKEVVEFINRGLNRILAYSKPLQVIITSRPSVFSDSVGFSPDLYPHFELTSITTEVTKNYVDKWIKANRLDAKEASEIKRLTTEKLEMPHLKELAKSPMQLAIFINLLRKRGESLPNKRTSLYDSYIELLFDRESEKSSIVRDQREIIIDIHKYLAWVLHSEAELYKNSGSIRIEDLVLLLENYLIKEGHKTDLASTLFDAMKDRVCALASRVQGTYEFEVQPLREYFCAKYLYETSPYSPLGQERSGTLPDRFDGICRNPYWLNVTRFFAGCFSKGELPMLIHKLQELQEDELLKYTNYPKLLTAQLLSDYVFTQYPKLLKDVVAIVVNGINIGNIIDQDGGRFNADQIILPIECGRTEIVAECFKQLKRMPPAQYARELIGIIKNNPLNTEEKWVTLIPEISKGNLTKWLRYGYWLQILYKIDESILLSFLKGADVNELNNRIQILVNANRGDVLEKYIEYKKIIYDGILDYKLTYRPRNEINKGVDFLALVLNSHYTFSNIINGEDENLPLFAYLVKRESHKEMSIEELYAIEVFNPQDYIDQNILNLRNKIFNVLKIENATWKTQIAPWSLLVEETRRLFNDPWCVFLLANTAASIKSNEDKLDEFEDLHNKNIDLCKRIKYARSKSGIVSYWEGKLQDPNIIFTLLVLFTWATPRCVISILQKLAKIIQELSKSEIQKLLSGLQVTCFHSIYTKTQLNAICYHLSENKVPDIIVYILSFRVEPNYRSKFVYDNVNDYSKLGDVALYYRLDYLIDEFLTNPVDGQLLKNIKLYGQTEHFFIKHYNLHMSDTIRIPLEFAKKIVTDCQSYPSPIVSLAEKTCRIYAQENLVPIGKIAKRERWF